MENECELCRLVEQSIVIIYEGPKALIVEKNENKWLAFPKEHIHQMEDSQLARDILGTLIIESFMRTNKSGEKVEYDLTLPYGLEHYHLIANFTEDYQDGSL